MRDETEDVGVWVSTDCADLPTAAGSWFCDENLFDVILLGAACECWSIVRYICVNVVRQIERYQRALWTSRDERGQMLIAGMSKVR